VERGDSVKAVAREQLCGHVVSPATREHAIMEEIFLCGPCRGYITRTSSSVVVEARVEAGSNSSTVALRIVGGDEKGTQCLGYNWATLFLGDINRGTWPSRLGESPIFFPHIYYTLICVDLF
jgi:hypothetical protein